MKTSTKLVVALALLLSATSVTLAKSQQAKSNPQPLYNLAAFSDPALSGGGSSGYNQMVIQDTGE